MTMSCRPATLDDWKILGPFYRRVYSNSHPLLNREFWRWQYGDERYGQAFIVTDEATVFGHLGVGLGGGMGWLLNLFVEPELRAQGWVRQLFAATRARAPLAASNASAAGMGLFRKLGFVRYCDLQRFVSVRPALAASEAIREVTISGPPVASDDRYWKQPGITGVLLSEGSTAVSQASVGGLRVISVSDPEKLAESCWAAGAAWADFVTSWNDPLCRALEANGWILGDPIPWLLNPPVPGSESKIQFLSEEPIDPTLIVRRTFSDHGRVGSLPPSDVE